MNFFLRYAGARVVETCLAGTGGFGRSFLAQSRHIPLVSARVLVERDPAIAVAALRDIGIDEDRFAVIRSPEDAKTAWDGGKTAIADDLAHVIGLPFDILIEATGHPEAGARHAGMAIAAGRHVALVSKEVDSVIGPGLARMARDRGVVATPVDGDQPSLLVGLITWAQVLGLEILAAGKSSEYDFISDPSRDTLWCNGQEEQLPEMAALFDGDAASLRDRVARRSEAASAFRQRAVPDLCELGVVANATGFGVDRPDLHAPIARIAEVPALFRERSKGGLLDSTGVLDVFHCLRRPDEISLAGGVFVVVRCTDGPTWAMLGEKGHILAPDGETAMLTLPRHLLGVEAATTILDAALRGESSGGAEPAHHVDLVAVATAELPAGRVLAMGGHHHTIADVEARLVPAGRLGPSSPAPFYLAANRGLTRAVAAGEPIRMGDLDLEDGGELLRLRRLQDDTFFPSGAVANAGTQPKSDE